MLLLAANIFFYSENYHYRCRRRHIFQFYVVFIESFLLDHLSFSTFDFNYTISQSFLFIIQIYLPIGGLWYYMELNC